MDKDIPFYLSPVFVLGGLSLLVYSSDLFISAASKVAKKLGISPFIIGMVVIGFGTSAPELCVSVMSGLSDHSALSLGNAYGSCIFNIAAILGVTAIIKPITAKRTTALVAGPVLFAISALTYCLLIDRTCSKFDSSVLLGLFLVLLPLYCWFDQKSNGSAGAGPDAGRKDGCVLWIELLKLLVGLALLVGSSHVLVWGSVDIARTFGVSELMIGLTIVAIGTSLPELASAIAAARRGEHEFVLGNIIGSNFFNTLAVVGLACVISPAKDISESVMMRDLPVMSALSISITLFAFNFRSPGSDGRIGRRKGLLWLAVFVVYTVFVILGERS
ncbi:MAG: calcium/sodium antiporter [Kiritimatiellae bacterium]|nr:calcium/sodium antiporter [Kiritimatiellia bacterium]MBR3777604.1 calcium/sodium antiporter [Kiritimatiellia bacterium]